MATASHDAPPSFSALDVDPGDPEVMRARASIEARLLGVPHVAIRIGRFLLLERIGAGGMGIVYAAFDPELERKVALKLLYARDGDPRHHERLRREAKAMARLAHPHVAHVYEVGEHQGRIFLAMEHVRGKTLRAWWSERSRSPGELLAMCLQAGRGLAAAHAAGLVHGDFKPDNVLVGEDGRARVVDFGLARVEDLSMDELTTGDVDERTGSGTCTGRFRGTPGYASPRQMRGEPADRKGDMFAFCVTVWEALTGARPDLGDVADPARTKMPAWIERVLRRELSPAGNEPTTRDFETLDDLMRALTRDPARTRRRWLAAGAILSAVAGAFAIGSILRAPPSLQPCTGGEDAIERAWPEDARAAALAHVHTIGGAYGETVAPLLADGIATFRPRWTAAYRDACLAHARGEQSDDLLDRRMTCLHRGRAALAALAEITADASAEALPGIVLAVAKLPDPEACNDVATLTKVKAPPPEIVPLLERHAGVEALREAGRLDDAAAAVTALLEDARHLGYAPFLAEVLRTHGLIEQDGGARRVAAEIYREAMEIALTEGDDEGALFAWGNRAWCLATGAASGDTDPLDGKTFAFALAARNPVSLASMRLHSSVGGAEIGRGRKEAARAAYARAIEIGEALGDRPRELALAKQQLAFITDDSDRRDRLFGEAVAMWTVAAGEGHPKTLTAAAFRAMFLDDPALARDQVVPVCREIGRLHPQLRDLLADCASQILRLSELLHDDAAVLAAAAQWAELATSDADLASATLANLRGDATTAASLVEPEVRRRRNALTSESRWFQQLALGWREVELGRAWSMLGDARADSMLDAGLRRIEESAHDKPQRTSRRQIEVAREIVLELRRARG